MRAEGRVCGGRIITGYEKMAAAGKEEEEEALISVFPDPLASLQFVLLQFSYLTNAYH